MTELNLNKIENKMQALRDLNIEINHILNVDNETNATYDDAYYLVAKRNSEAFELTKLLIESNKDAYEFIHDYWRKFEKDAWNGVETPNNRQQLKGIETEHPHAVKYFVDPLAEHRNDSTGPIPTDNIATQTNWSETSDTDATPTNEPIDKYSLRHTYNK